MNVNRSQLLEVLTNLRPGLAQKDIVEQNVCFCFHENKIVTFNDNILAKQEFQSGINGGVRAEELYKLLTKLAEDTIDIDTKESEFLLSSGKTTAGFSLVEVSYPTVEPVGEWKQLSEELMKCITESKDYVSTNMTRPKFTCVHIKDDKVISSDGYRVNIFYLSETSPFNFLLPGFAVNELQKYTFSHILVDSNWVHFKNASNLLFSVRKFSDEFFDESQIEKYVDVTGESVTLPDMTNTLDRCMLMVDSEVEFEAKVELSFSPDKLICKSKKEGGWVQEEVDIEYSGKDFKILINPKRLSEILKQTSNMIVGEDRCLFIGDKVKHVMVLIGE